MEMKAKTYLHLDTYWEVRDKIFQKFDERIEEIIEAEDWDLTYKTLDEMEQILKLIENLEKQMGLDDDE